MTQINSRGFILLSCLFLPTACYGWMGTLKIMRHPDGHIVRLAGDVHVEAFVQHKSFYKALQQEEMFLHNIEEPLVDFLNKGKASELFVVEKIIADVMHVSRIIPKVLAQGSIAALPLITRMNILAHPSISHSSKALAAAIHKQILRPKIELLSYDIRSTYHKLSTLSFPTNKKEHDSFSQELTRNQSFFIQDLEKLLASTNNYHEKFCTLIADIANLLIEKVKDRSMLEDFFTIYYTDFGYLTLIAKNCHRNITLYLGVIHCHNVAQYLELAGYETVFEKGAYTHQSFGKNIIPECRSKKDYQLFFEYRSNTSN